MSTTDIKSQDITAPIYETFFSYQGEGPYTGMPQIFVRFAGCNIRCAYCDTAYALKASSKTPRLNASQLLANIYSLAKKHKKKFMFGKPSVSITGGEPLVYADFLSKFLPELKRNGFSVYLETNGTLPGQFEKIKSFCDIVSTDFKFASECKKSFWKEHKRFLSSAVKAKAEVFVKAVITGKTKLSEIKKSADVIRAAAPGNNIAFILQPSAGISQPQPAQIHAAYREASRLLKDARVMFQMHKIFKIK